MKTILKSSCILLSMGYQLAFADSNTVTPGGSILKMLIGLIVVLGVMALITWGLKRLMPHGIGTQSVAKVVGGVSVGTRERVVVVEVGDRWLVVGVAPGQVTSIANLEINSIPQALSAGGTEQNMTNAISPITTSFSHWLKKSLDKKSDTGSKVQSS